MKFDNHVIIVSQFLGPLAELIKEMISNSIKVILITGDNFNIKSLIKGDQYISEISAASIVAKVTRDHLMVDYSNVYHDYSFYKHKGYGTKQHYQEIRVNITAQKFLNIDKVTYII